MNKTVIAAAVAAILVSAGTAFAGSDNFKAEYRPGLAKVDQGTTASISSGQSDSVLKTLLNSNVKIEDSGRGIWGR